MAKKEDVTFQNDELNTLAEIAKTLTTHAELPDLFQAIVEQITNLFPPAEFGLILLWDPVERVLRVEASYGQEIKNKEHLHSMTFQENESLPGLAYTTQKALLLSSPGSIEEARKALGPKNKALMSNIIEPGNTLHSLLALPISTQVKNFGVLVLGAVHGPTHFTETDQSFLKIIADLIARSIERALRESEKALNLETEQVTQMRAEALAVLSHEMRTPLAAIKGYSTALLLEEVHWSDEKQKEFLRFIDEECDNLQVMVTDILDSSLIDFGQFTLEYQPVRLEKVAAETAEDMQRRSDLHKLVVDFPKDFPIVDADPLRIRQIIRNIIDNSIKYSPDGGLIVIRGEVRLSYVVVSISDQGVGISPEDLIPLFDKYFRVKSPTGYYVPGTGLGLPVARALVEEHKGRIWAESKVGEGTTLFFSIPLTQTEKPDTQN